MVTVHYIITKVFNYKKEKHRPLHFWLQVLVKIDVLQFYSTMIDVYLLVQIFLGKTHSERPSLSLFYFFTFISLHFKTFNLTPYIIQNMKSK